MQLTGPRRGRLSRTLGLLTANLLIATAAHGQEAILTQPPAACAEPDDKDYDVVDDTGATRIDGAVLSYQEGSGRVHVTEAVVGATLNSSYGDALTVRVTTDTLTGATPNGAAPWSAPQTFTTPAHAPGTSTTVTSASGHSTIVTIPGSGLVARQYTVAAGALPMDLGFRDQRTALDVGFSTSLDRESKASFGASYSTERDYTSWTATTGYSRDFFDRNTTISAGLSYEYDQSKPFFGTPTGFTVMSAAAKGPAKNKQVVGLVLGVTQVMGRHWLTQLNYSVGSTSGYQSDPYRVLSVVDPTTGGPQQYLYEKRPNSRLRQSVYWGNKIALGPTVTDVSARAYHDDWGISSTTLEVSEYLPVFRRFYLEPEARYYKQTKADFFRGYLVGGQPLPAYASSDSRLDAFTATTYGLKAAFKVTPGSEFYVLAEDYKQSGDGGPSKGPGYLAGRDLFSGVNARSVMVGYTFAFY